MTLPLEPTNPPPREIRLDAGHIARLGLAILWLCWLAWYCSGEQKQILVDIANPELHQASIDDGIPAESLHVEIAQLSGTDKIAWRVLRENQGLASLDESLLRIRPDWGAFRSNERKQFFWGFATTRAIRYVLTPEALKQKTFPDPEDYKWLLYTLMVVIFLSLTYGLGTVFCKWGYGAAHWTHVTVLLILLIGLFHSVLTAVQGGLIVSPVGSAFTTIPALLVAHALAVYDSVPKSHRLFYFLPSIVFTIGSIAAHVYATYEYEQSVLILLQQVYQPEYLRWIALSLGVGIASIVSRRFKKTFTTVTVT